MGGLTIVHMFVMAFDGAFVWHVFELKDLAS